MKKIIFTLVLAFLVQIGFAQSCSEFINASNNKKLVYANFDAKGNTSNKLIYNYKRKDASTVSVHSDILDKNGQTIGNADYDMSCDGDVIKIDMKSLMQANSAKQLGNMHMEGEAKYVVYPLNLKTGQTLEDASVIINLINDGRQMGTMEMNITDRKVEAAENMTTGAGSFDCFRISYNALMRIRMMGIGFPIHVKVKEWFSPKMGRFVKSETYSKNDKSIGSMQLESIN